MGMSRLMLWYQYFQNICFPIHKKSEIFGFKSFLFLWTGELICFQQYAYLMLSAIKTHS